MQLRPLSLSLLLLVAPSIAYAATINVPGDVATIRDAIRVAEPGDTILVAPLPDDAMYEETVRIKRLDNLTLTAEDGVILAPGGDRDAIVVRSSDGVTISNFEIETAAYAIRLVNCDDSLIMDNTITGTRAGMLVTLGNGNVLMGNTIENLTGAVSELGIPYGGNAIRIQKSTNAVVQDSTISSDLDVPLGDGIVGYRADAAIFRDNDVSGLGRNCMRLRKSPDAQIVGENVCADNILSGIRVNRSANVTVNGADASGNGRLGIFVRKSEGITLTNNTADFNERYGIRSKKSQPLTSVGGLIAAGNTARSNGTDYRVDN